MKIQVLDIQSEGPRFMIKEKFIIDQLTTTNANLVDQIGRMQTHIEGLWEEVGFKNEKINDLHFEKAELNEKFKELYKKLYEMEVRKSSAEKSMTEFFGDRTDN